MLKKAYVLGVTGDYETGILSDIIDFEGSILTEGSGLQHAVLDLPLLRDYRNKVYSSRRVPRF